MNNKFFALALVFGLAANSFAADTAPAINYKEALSSVKVLEMPAKAAELVKQTAAKDRETITATVVKNAADLKPTALPTVVGAIAKSNPEMAATAAGVAVAAQPKLCVDIAKAAAASAPARASEIVTAICKVLPKEYHAVAVAVAKIVPDSAKSILAAVGAAIPNLKPFIEQAGAGSAAGQINVSGVLAQAQTLAASTTASTTPTTAPPVRPPTVGAPYNPLPSGTGGTGSVTNSGVLPPGGRDYTGP